MIAYKLFRQKANGAITSLFINKSVHLPIDQWMEAEDHPTRCFAHRPGWHCMLKPEAPHLSMKGRVWLEVEIEDFQVFERPKSQGGTWMLARRMRIPMQKSLKPVENTLFSLG
jgi:hypothetical protein